MLTVPAHKSNVNPIASHFEVRPETAAHNRTTVVVAHIPDFTAYIIGGGQGWTAAFVLFNVIWSALQRKFETFANGSHFLSEPYGIGV